MKYVILATALTLAQGSGIASAVAGSDGQEPDPNTNAPASASAADQTQGAQTQGADAEERAKRIQPVDLLFQTASSDLTSDAHQDLVTMARWAKCNEKGALILEGHADVRGTQAYNMELSAERAAVVRQKLIAMGVPPARILVTVYGKNGPRRDTMAENRRVTVRAAATPVQASDIVATK